MSETPKIPSQFIAPTEFGPRVRFGRPPQDDPQDVPQAPVPDQHDRTPDEAPERDQEAVAATPAAAAPSPGPDPLAAGTYAVYEDGHGGVMLVIGTREGEIHKKHLSAKIIKMGEMMMGGNSPLSAFLGGA